MDAGLSREQSTLLVEKKVFKAEMCILSATYCQIFHTGTRSLKPNALSCVISFIT